MATALARDAAHSGEFYFSKNILPSGMPNGSPEHYNDITLNSLPDGSATSSEKAIPAEDYNFTLMDIDTIMNGKVVVYCIAICFSGCKFS